MTKYCSFADGLWVIFMAIKFNIALHKWDPGFSSPWFVDSVLNGGGLPTDHTIIVVIIQADKPSGDYMYIHFTNTDSKISWIPHLGLISACREN